MAERRPVPAWMRVDRDERAGLLAGLAAIALWCCTGACFATGSRLLGPMVYTTAICAMGFGAGLSLHMSRGRPWRSLFAMPLRVWFAGFAGISVYTVLLVLAVGIASDADVAQVVLVNYLWPLFILAIGALLPGEDRPTGRALAVLLVSGALGFTGVALARGPEALARPPADLLPHALALAGAVLWASYCVLLRRWNVPDDRNGSTAQWALCAMLAAMVGWFRGEWSQVGPVTGEAVFWIAFCGIGPVGLAYYWWETGMKRGPASTIAALSFFIPIGSAILMAGLFRETLSPYLLPGATLIALSSVSAHRVSRSSLLSTLHSPHDVGPQSREDIAGPVTNCRVSDRVRKDGPK